MPVQYNALTTMADVYAETGELIGAVPHTRQGLLAAEDAVLTYALIGERAARRVIVLAGGTPNAGPLRRQGESWETSVTRHQRQLRLAHAGRAGAQREAA